MYLLVEYTGGYSDFCCCMIGLYGSIDNSMASLIKHLKQKFSNQREQDIQRMFSMYDSSYLLFTIEQDEDFQYDKHEFRSQGMVPNNSIWIDKEMFCNYLV